MKIVGIIPARYQSSRFPGKPLANILGKPMIQHVYENSSKVLSDVFVATDDDRIFNTVTDFGGNAVMTGIHNSGTERVCEALGIIEKMQNRIDVVINIQGDEPFLKEEHLNLLIKQFDDGEVKIATLIKKISSKNELFDPNIPKVTFSKYYDAIYFSRSVIPYLRNQPKDEWLNIQNFYKHIGIYAYRSDVLKEITKYEKSPLEEAESLEQLRWLENGMNIKIALTKEESKSIDTPDDLTKLIDTLSGK